MSIRKTGDLSQAIAEIEAWHSDIVYDLEKAEEILNRCTGEDSIEELNQMINDALGYVSTALNELR